MLPLDSPHWSQYNHAYGPAADLPALLRRAPLDFQPGHHDGSTWFDLWSALCHQGDPYTASYAAVPHLVEVAAGRAGTDAIFDPLHLVACIELARLEGTAPTVPAALASDYHTAVQAAHALTLVAIARSWPAEYEEALRGYLAALNRQPEDPGRIFDSDLEDDEFEEDP